MEFRNPKHNQFNHPKMYVAKKTHIHKITLSKKSPQAEIPNEEPPFTHNFLDIVFIVRLKMKTLTNNFNKILQLRSCTM